MDFKKWLNEPIDIRFQPLINIQKQEYITLKITPERNIRNYNNELILEALSDLYEPISSRLYRKSTLGIRIYYRPLSRLYYDVIYRSEDVSFYLTIPKEWEDLFRQKIDRAWEHSGVDIVSDPDYPKPDITMISELRYLRHNIFSLRTDKDDNDPLNDQLTIVDYLKPGDVVRVSIVVEPTSLKDWFDQCDDAYKQVRLHQMPKRSYDLLSNKRQLLWRLLESILRELAGFLLEVFTDSGTEYAAPKDPVLEVMMAKGTLSPSTNSKMGSQVFSTQIRVISQSVDRLRRETNLRSVTNSYKSLKHDNELIQKCIPQESIGKLLDNLYRRDRIVSLDPNLMSSREWQVDVLADVRFTGSIPHT